MNTTDYKSVAFVCLGCKVNRAEVDEFSSELYKCGFVSAEIENADFVIINTCTVTHVADKKTRQMVRKVCNKNLGKDARIFVTGCAAVMDPETYAGMDARVRVIKKSDIIDEVLKASGHTGDASLDNKCNQVQGRLISRSRANLKIQDGCDNACTYCIVHTARGKATSLPADIVEEKFRALLAAGHREIVLSGVDLGAYYSGEYDLAKICQRLLGVIDTEVETGFLSFDKTEMPARIRISSIEPQNVSDDLIKLMQTSEGRICRHLHLPLQSGAGRILRQMNRHYTADEYLQIVERLRSAMPSISLSTDIIVGFPGETESDFNDTIEIARKCGFMKIHVFPYSKREGTPAAQRSDQIPEGIKSERAASLRKVSEELRQSDLCARKGTSEFVLVESDKTARTESYHLIDFNGEGLVGSLQRVKL